MRAEYRFTCGLRNGLHARPASLLAETARRFSARITLSGGEGDRGVDIRSVLSVVGLDVKSGQLCIVVAEGEDAEAAVGALRALVEVELGKEDEAPPPVPRAATAALVLPVGLRRLGVTPVLGRGACAGTGIGSAVVVGGLALPASMRSAKPGPAEIELAAARAAIDAVVRDLGARRAAAAGATERELIGAHGQIAGDPALWAEIESGIRSGLTAAVAVAIAGERAASGLRAAPSQYIRERAVDVQDVCMQVLRRLPEADPSLGEIRLERDSIVCAEILTPSQLLAMDRRLLRGLVLGAVGATSHTVILARSLGVPTICDVEGAAGVARAGEPVVVDGEAGFAICPAGPPVLRYFERERCTQQRRSDRIAPLVRRPAVTKDGVRLEIGANASSPDEVRRAVENGAEGVGLFRTEVLFLDRPAPPSEEEQFRAYAAVLSAAAGRPVIIRTFDIGGDKPAPYLRMAREENPFLGVRGLRLYEHHPELLRGQLRAICRASALGPVKVMAPMVATPTEAAWFRARVRAVQDELRLAGVPFEEAMPVGAMIEVPAAAFAIRGLAESMDFFSIGTNDLCQYFMAVDRGNAGVTGLYTPRAPAFLRLLQFILAEAKAAGRWVGVCGEMAGDKRNLPLMIGLGVDEISVAPGETPVLKALTAEASAAACRELLGRAAAQRDLGQVEALLSGAAWRERTGGGGRIVAPELVAVGSDSQSKEEAIKEAVDLLFIAGRAENPRQLEEDVWTREATYSTALGFGFAVPHCRSAAVEVPTLAVLKLRAEIEWGDGGGAVGTVLLLAVPASDAAGAHMKVFAKLARKLMHDEFRGALGAAAAPDDVVRVLTAELGLEASTAD